MMATKILGRICRISFTAKGVLCSLGFHAAACMTAFAWFSTPNAHITFVGNRYAVQLEASFAEPSISEELETELEVEPLLTAEDLQEPLVQELIPEPTTPPPELELSLDSEYKVSITKPTEPNIAASSPTQKIAKQQLQTELQEPKKTTPPTTTVSAAATESQTAGIDQDLPPDLSANQPPSYPREAIQKQLEGVVLLKLTIDMTGKITEVTIKKTSGHSILDRAAVEAVRKWQARPAIEDGHPAESAEVLPICFKL